MRYLVSGTAQWLVSVDAEDEDAAEKEAENLFPDDVDFEDHSVDSIEEED